MAENRSSWSCGTGRVPLAYLGVRFALWLFLAGTLGPKTSLVVERMRMECEQNGDDCRRE